MNRRRNDPQPFTAQDRDYRLVVAFCGLMFGLCVAMIAKAGTTAEFRVNLLRGTTTVVTVVAQTPEQAWETCNLEARARTESTRTQHTCQTLRSVVSYVNTTPPVPVPVNCAGTWSNPPDVSAWSACVSGQQSRTVTRRFTVTTPPANGGTACPASPDVDTETRACTVTPPVEPPPAGAGTPLSMLPGSYPVWIAGGARHENVSGAAWDGSPVARIWPPTSEQTYGGIGGWTVSGRSVALRFEFRAGPTYASGGQGFVDNKFIIFHTTNGNRPMLNWQSSGGGGLQLAIAQGTVKQFNQRAVGGSPAGYWTGQGDDVFRLCDAASANAKCVPAGEWLSISVHVTCGNELHASGSIRAQVYRRSGVKLADWWIPWNYDAPARCTDITRIEGIGDYYNGRGNGASGTYFDLAGVTIVPNSSILAPRAGFVQ